MEEAIEWGRRCPSDPSAESALEIRPVFDGDDFGGAEFSPELRAQEERLCAEIEQQRKP